MTENQLKLPQQNGCILSYVSGILLRGYGLQVELDPGVRTKFS